MNLLRSVAAVTLCCAVAGVSAPAGAAPGRAEPQRCRDVVLYNAPGVVFTQTRGLWAIRTSCRIARVVSRRYLSRSEGNAGPRVRPLGFRCSGGADGVACRKGKRTVTWGYYID